MAGETSKNGSTGDHEAVTAPSSPTSKVKFLCSHGGKILPRPTDNHLKYVGGETRVVAVHRDITFSELMKKLISLFEGNVVLKYQLASEDLDALVSVRSDEDLKYMFEEYYRQEKDGTSRLRAFLFAASPIVVDWHTSPMDAHAIEQRYIDAINGVIRTHTTAKIGILTPNRHTFSISSACSSPKSPSPDRHGQTELVAPETISVQSYQAAARGIPMHKVHSSPSLHNHNTTSPYPGSSPGNQHYLHQQQQIHHHHSPSLPPQPHILGYHSPKPPQDPYSKVVGTEKLAAALAAGRTDAATRNPFSHGYGHYPANRYHRGSGGHHYDETGI